MRYILDKRYRFRGWYRLPYGIYDTAEHKAKFFSPEIYDLLLKCDAGHDLDPEHFSEREKRLIAEFEASGMIRRASWLDFLLPEQKYHVYPARYRENVHWSVTGLCNLKCRHCFMSAPHARHGSPSTEELLSIADQLAECGVFNVGITGGEPLIREDFTEIVKALSAREIRITALYTNGWLVNGELLDMLETNRQHPAFQLSYDGIGRHDFLRGVAGAEKKTTDALKLLRERDCNVSVSMCLHRENADTLRESVRLLADLGVRSMKCGAMMDLGEWTDPEIRELHLTPEEEMDIFERYIPQYFKDDAPMSISLSGVFLYEKGRRDFGSFFHRECPKEKEDLTLACPVLGTAFYIGADGVVAPCQGMCDCGGFAENLPSLKEKPLREILCESEYVQYCYATVGDVRRGNTECGECVNNDRCAGGCRNSALIAGDNYYGEDPGACRFYKNGGPERIRAAAQPAFEAYLKRHPEIDKENRQDPADISCL